MMKNTFKLLLVLVLTISIAPINSINAFAYSFDMHENVEYTVFAEKEIYDTTLLVTGIVGSDIDISLFMDIPIFFAEIEPGNNIARDEAMLLIMSLLSEHELSNRDMVDEQGIRQLSDFEITELANNPIYFHALRHHQMRIKQGELIDYIVFFVPTSTENQLGRMAPLNNSYLWLDGTNYLGTYQGFQFRYLEHAAPSGSTKDVDIANLAPRINLGQALFAGVNLTVEIFAGKVVQIFSSTLGLLSDIFDIIENPSHI